jgi:hypothetical protein
VPWVETTSPHFAARHELADEDDVVGVLEQLEATRERLVGLFPQVPEEVAIVVHGSDAALTVAQPYLPLLRRLTAPAARRYLVGWFGRDTVNLLAPSALYTQVVVGASNRRLPPPFRPASLARYLRWAWLAAGAGQHFSGQTAHARPAIARRLHEGPEPSFPPGLRDAQLLGGTVLDLLAREEGEAACAALACELPPGGPREALVSAFHGRSLVHTEGTWRAYLARIAGRP